MGRKGTNLRIFRWQEKQDSVVDWVWDAGRGASGMPPQGPCDDGTGGTTG